MTLPDAVARQRYAAVDSATLLFGGKPASDDGNGERLFDAVGLQNDADALWRLAAEQGHVIGAECDDAIEHVGVGAQGDDVPAGHVEGAELAVGAGDCVAYADQPLSVGERERPE